ncbi:MAG TPA: chemotaxis protein CheW, partial [Sphingomicrobium sp.]
PRSAIEEIVRTNGESVTREQVGGAGIATIRGRRVPEIALADILGIDSNVTAEARTLVVLRPAGGDLYALAVDKIHDHEELVVKPAAPAVMATGLYAGTTLADDGSPILLFDPAGLAHIGGVKLESHERASRVAEGQVKKATAATPVLLFRGLDGGRRALRLALVDRIEEVPVAAIKKSAGRLRIQLGDSIVPIAGLEGSELPGGKMRLFRLSDGVSELGYAFHEVIDLATIDNDVIDAESAGEVGGVTLIAGEPAELLDAHWLFAKHTSRSKVSTKAPVCRLPSDDPWMQNMLRPIVESAGYRVVDEDDECVADVVIASEEFDGPQSGEGRLIRLRSTLETAGDADSSIYRYDRAGLLMALKSAGSGGMK